MEPFLQSLIKALPDSVSPAEASDCPVIVDEQDPIRFWNRITGAIGHARSIVLLDPGWPMEWKQEYADIARRELPGESCRILIPTSGTTGKPKFCVHTIQTLRFAAKAFADAFAAKGILHSVNVLPQHHVGGMMPVLRSAQSGGRVFFASYLDDFTHAGFDFDPLNASISLVPTQLSRMLKSEIHTRGLRRFGMILVGGAACADSLLEKARESGLRLAPCYGSTETAALVTVMDPDSFLLGHDGVGKPLPGMQVSLDKDRRIQIRSGSLQSGYCPASGTFDGDLFRTHDLGMLDHNGNLHMLGRADRVIITGGKKVIPGQVESICMRSGMVEDAWCHGASDEEWGNRVELTVVFREKDAGQVDSLMGLLRAKLPFYAVPKQIHPVDSITRNQMGKLAPRSR